MIKPAFCSVPATIVTGSHLVARWLKQQIALRRGIAAGLDLVTFDAFVERTWSEGARADGEREQQVPQRAGGALAHGQRIERVEGMLRRAPDFVNSEEHRKQARQDRHVARQQAGHFDVPEPLEVLRQAVDQRINRLVRHRLALVAPASQRQQRRPHDRSSGPERNLIGELRRLGAGSQLEREPLSGRLGVDAGPRQRQSPHTPGQTGRGSGDAGRAGVE